MWLTATSSPSISSVGRIGNSTTSRPAAIRRERLSARRSLLGVARRRALSQHLAGTREGGDEVDVAVGVAVLGEALAQPHHALDAQVVAQPLLDLLARQRRVAVGVQQALLGGQQRPLAVDGDRAALEHEGRFVAAVAEAVDEQPADRRVGVVGRELLAPRVEAEVHAGARAVTVEDEDRSAVAQPRVVDRELDDLDVAGQRGARLGGVLRRRRRPWSAARTRRPRWRWRRSRPWPDRAGRPRALRRQGQPMMVRSCGAHSAGIRKPSAAGVLSAAPSACGCAPPGARRR